LRNVEVKGLMGRVHVVSVERIAYGLVLLGTVALLSAAAQNRVAVRVLRKSGLTRRYSLTFGVAVILALLGWVAFGALVSAK
jgi:hypothetical protein